MPRTGEYDASEAKGGIGFEAVLECGEVVNREGQFEETPCRDDCPDGERGQNGCGLEYQGEWVDDSITVQDMREAPESVQICPHCGHKQMAVYPGWSTYGDA
jgi:hypothetical protein